jgi:hypothetical protein
MLAASAEPSRRALCCTAVVKKEDEFISSQRSNLKKCEQAGTSIRKAHRRRLIPVRCNIVKIEFDDWPQSICHESAVAFAQEPICVSDQCC